MVSFSCEVCNDTVIKKKLDQHAQRCRGAYFTCIDCSKTFYGQEHRTHTLCISEAEKYEKALYKGKKTGQKAEPVKGKAEKAEKPVKEKAEKAKTEKAEKALVEKAPKGKAELDLGAYHGSLYKVIKSIAKDTKLDKKDVLKKLQLTTDGKLVVGK